MKTALIAAFCCAASLVLPIAHAQGLKFKAGELADYQARAESGEPKAQVVLAQYYLLTLGKEKDPLEGIRWARKAAAQNEAEAQVLLAGCYMSGDGVEKDLKEAMRWYRKAAEQNHVMGQFGLGVGYSKGLGMEKDEKEAYAWLSLAARAQADAAVFRDRLEKQFSTEQLADAKQRTEVLRAQIEARLKKGGK